MKNISIIFTTLLLSTSLLAEDKGRRERYLKASGQAGLTGELMKKRDAPLEHYKVKQVLIVGQEAKVSGETPEAERDNRPPPQSSTTTVDLRTFERSNSVTKKRRDPRKLKRAREEKVSNANKSRARFKRNESLRQKINDNSSTKNKVSNRGYGFNSFFPSK